MTTTIEELKRLAEKATPNTHFKLALIQVCDFIDAATPETILALIAEREALRKDAERYRWLRENVQIRSGTGGMDMWRIILPDPGIGLDTDRVFDAAIDAARKGQ